MPLSFSLSFPSTGIGPGILVQVATDLIGPIANDDFTIVYVNRDPLPSGNFCAGLALFHGSHFADVVLGAFEIGSPIAASEAVVDGTAAQLRAFAYHANGTVWDSGSATGYFYWSTSALWFLGVRQSTASTSAVLNAVQQVYSNAP